MIALTGRVAIQVGSDAAVSERGKAFRYLVCDGIEARLKLLRDTAVGRIYRSQNRDDRQFHSRRQVTTMGGTPVNRTAPIRQDQQTMKISDLEVIPFNVTDLPPKNRSNSRVRASESQKGEI